MAIKTSASQRKTIGRVMHEAKHGELNSGLGGKGGRVRSRKQAIAIALHEAGASRQDTPVQRRRSLARTKSKEARGRTGQQEKEGKSHVGARGEKESSPAMRPMSQSARSRTKTASTRSKPAAARSKASSTRSRSAAGRSRKKS